MRYKKEVGLALMMVYATITMHAQSAIDALRYNSTFQIGTARNIAVGGSMGSMGGDFSILCTNPGGIARFKTTEFQISPNVVFGNTVGNYLGNSLQDEHLKFNISSMGLVFAKRNEGMDWASFSAGFGLNRLNYYDDHIFISGTNTNNSLLDLHAQLANGNAPESLANIYPFDAGLTYLGDLLVSDSNLNYTSILGNVAPNQDITINRSGGKYEASLGGGGNYMDKLYVGASIGIPIINFRETEIIAEQDANNEVERFNYFDLRNELRSTGYGVNFKLGVLGEPNEYVRIGAAFHTPTLLSMKDQYYTIVNSDFDTVAYEVESPDGEFSYQLINPWKFIGNVGFLIGKYGFISTEYELQNPGNSKFKFKSNDADIKREEDARNAEIAEIYDWQHHIKVGIEVKLEPIRLRAGFQYKTAAFANKINPELIFSGGIGYRGKHFFVDGAYTYSASKSEFVPYELGNISSGVAQFDHKRSQVTFTVGAKL